MTLLLALFLFAVPPDSLSLDWFYREAEAHYPLRRELALRDEIAALRVQNLSARTRPSVSLGGQAAWQSEVPRFPVVLPGVSFPEVSRDQYRLGVTVDQLLYDGGTTAGQKAVEYAGRDVARQQVAVELYRLRERVDEAFFGVLVSQAQAASLETLAADLRAKLRLVEARVRGGVLLASNADVLTAEILRVEGQQVDLEARRRAALGVLAELTGRPLGDDVALAVPEVEIDTARSVPRGRPEHALFALRRAQLARQAALRSRQSGPVVAAFAEAAYGRPAGMNLFDNAFQPFYSAGVRVRWAVWDWGVSGREQGVLALEQEAVSVQERIFAMNLAVAVRQELSDVTRLEELLRKDDEIIALRQRIVAGAASQMENGVITATDYLAERNAEHQARLTRDLHRLQLAQARVRYLTTVGHDE